MNSLIRSARVSVAGSLAALVAVCGLLTVPAASARPSACAVGDSISVRDLPRQGRDMLALIQAGGPFPNDRDGIVFGNRERALPRAARGFYHEYTVRTPGVRNRGARRIVCGGDQRAADTCYYSDDHYQSFKCIAR